MGYAIGLTDLAPEEFDYGDRIRELAKVRDAALAELDDPMARLIAAGRRAMKSHNGARECRCGQCIELRDAIDYAEQRRAREAREGL